VEKKGHKWAFASLAFSSCVIGGTFTTLGFIDAALLGLQTQEAVN
jgi:hypothetical protein